MSQKKVKQPKKLTTLERVHPNAGALDIGALEIWAAVPPEQTEENVRCFGTFTVELEALADWLIECGVDTVVMASTGVYWIPVFEILEAGGLKVSLVNARHVKNVPGRKSDFLDCQSPKGSPRGRRGALAKRSGCNNFIAWVCSMAPSARMPRWWLCGPICGIGPN
jgi:hypothetical protein